MKTLSLTEEDYVLLLRFLRTTLSLLHSEAADHSRAFALRQAIDAEAAALERLIGRITLSNEA